MVSQKAKQRRAAMYKGKRSPLPDDHFGRLDLRIGKINDVMINPTVPHKYFLASINFGGISSDVINTMLIRHYEEEDLMNRTVICCCNVRLLWVKEGFCYTSLIVASSPEFGTKFELLIPPEGAEPGDVITVPEYPPNPDYPYMDPKSGYFEKISEHIKISYDGQVLFRSRPWIIKDKPENGVVRTERILNTGFLKLV